MTVAPAESVRRSSPGLAMTGETTSSPKISPQPEKGLLEVTIIEARS
jgi:hypothetical protein